MSHIVKIRTEVRDAEAVAAACRRLGVPAPVRGTAKRFSGAFTGLLVKRPWLYPAGVPDETTPRHAVKLERYPLTTVPQGAPPRPGGRARAWGIVHPPAG